VTSGIHTAAQEAVYGPHVRRRNDIALLFTLAGAADRWSPPPGVFPILGWVNPPGDFTTQERYDEMAEAGFTLVHHCSDKAAPFAKKAGMYTLASLGTPDPATDAGKATIEGVVGRWKDEPTCLGYSLRDEPGASAFPLLAGITREAEKLDPDGISFINLFPNYANEKQLGTKTYAEHVEKYLSEVKPRVLCFDHYPLVGKDAVRGNYYENLEIIRAAALRHDVPFWAFALTCPHGSYRNPTEAEVRFQVFSDIVYGAQGIFYFTYWTPRSSHWDFHNAIIDVDGTRTEHFEQVKRVNAKLKGWGPVLLKLSSKEVRHVGDVPAGARAYPTDRASGGDFIIGEFSHEDGSEWLILMNKDFRSTQFLTLTLPGVKALSEWWETGELLGPIESEDGAFEIPIAAGDARLFMIGEPK